MLRVPSSSPIVLRPRFHRSRLNGPGDSIRTPGRLLLGTVVLLGWGASGLSNALADAVYLMDFNTTDTGSHVGGAAIWNIFAAPGNINGGVLHDTSESTAAGLTLSVAGTIADSTNGGTLVFDNASGGPSWVTTDGTRADTGAAGDYFFTSTATNGESFTLTVGNLTPGTTVALDLWISRVTASSDGFYEYSLNGVDWSGFSVLEKDGTLSAARNWDTNTTQTQGFQGILDGNNAARYMHADGILLTGTSLNIRTTDTELAGSWSAIGAVRLSTSTVIPEPGSFMLLLFGGLVLGKRLAYKFD